jgi:hypothetical protein
VTSLDVVSHPTASWRGGGSFYLFQALINNPYNILSEGYKVLFINIQAESSFISKNHCLSQNSFSFVEPYGLLITSMGNTNPARGFQLVNSVRVQ